MNNAPVISGPGKRPPAGKTAPMPLPMMPSPGATLVKPWSGKVSVGVMRGAQRIGIYGPGGSGKTTLASYLERVEIPTLFLDLEAGSRFLNVSRVLPETFDEVRAVLHDAKLLDGFDAVVVDSLTKLEELATTWTLANVKHEKGHQVDSVEGYGYGKGYTHVYETFLLVLSDLDALVRQGKHVVGICHDCTASVPNPAGEDWIRYEPRLQNSKTCSIRHRVKEWSDHFFYLGYDVTVDKQGKAKGGGTRTIYPMELPTHLAKSRTLADPIPFEKDDPVLWNLLFGKESHA